MIFYEYPFNESIRTMLRLEHLFLRLAALLPRETALDHHHALSTVFEIMDVASRADVKADLLQELERQRLQLATYRGNPSISEQALELTLQRVGEAHQQLLRMPGKAGQALSNNEWLMSVRSRISIPGGTCSFDLPGYHAWQQEGAQQRHDDLQRWTRSLDPLSEALTICLGLLREGGAPQYVVVHRGQFQHSLGNARSYQLVRVAVDPERRLVPEISGNRLLVSVRLMRADLDRRLTPVTEDVRLEMTLCP